MSKVQHHFCTLRGENNNEQEVIMLQENWNIEQEAGNGFHDCSNSPADWGLPIELLIIILLHSGRTEIIN